MYSFKYKLFILSDSNHVIYRSDWTTPPHSLHSKQVINHINVHYSCNYLPLGETVLINSDSSLDLTKHVTARFIRLVIVETNDVTPSIKPITLNKYIITISVQHFYTSCLVLSSMAVPSRAVFQKMLTQGTTQTVKSREC